LPNSTILKANSIPLISNSTYLRVTDNCYNTFVGGNFIGHGLSLVINTNTTVLKTYISLTCKIYQLIDIHKYNKPVFLWWSCVQLSLFIFKNYFKTAFRSLVRNRNYTTIQHRRIGCWPCRLYDDLYHHPVSYKL
jgi:hypothetical protein